MLASLLLHVALVALLGVFGASPPPATVRHAATVRALPFEPPEELDAAAPDRPPPTPEPEPPEDITPTETPPPLSEVPPVPEEQPLPLEPHRASTSGAPSSPAPDVIGLLVRSRPPARAELPPPASTTATPPPASTDGGPQRPPRPPLRAIENPDPPLVPEIPIGVKVSLMLEYTISADGRVIEARVANSSGFPTQDAVTRDFVVSQWRYFPPGTERRVIRRFVFAR
jgi:outer membrane biosynthesis protein TonB